MAGLSMPSGRSAAKVSGARVGNSLTDFHGRAVTQSGTGGNALMNAGAAPGASAPTVNALAGGVWPPPVPAAAPVAVAAQAEPAVPAGHEMHAAIGKALGADNLPDDEMATRLKRSLFVQNAFRNLLHKDTPPDHGDVAQVVADGVKSGAVTAADAPALMAIVPQDPAQLRPAIEALNRIATHVAVHLVGEQQRRKSGSKA